MASPDFPDRDLRLERLGGRGGKRPAPYGDIAHVGSPFAAGAETRRTWATREALIDAVFTAPGVAEWLRGMKLKVAALVAA
jgi:hypothetical protein